MDIIEARIINYMEQTGILDKIKGKTVYVGVSGGADSMVLLCFLSKYKYQLNLSVHAIHVNHGIRGESADSDERFVSQYCLDNGISLRVFNAAKDPDIVIPEHASEEWARELRYKYFNDVMKLSGAGYIATAHTISDQCETMLFRLARGTGLKGLGCIRPIRDKFIRPLLGITRKEVEELASLYHIEYCTDETNLTDIYNRNKLRHTVMPTMRVINPNAENALSTTCERMAEAQEFIETMRDDILDKACIVKNHCYSTKVVMEQQRFMRSQLIIWLLENALSQSKTNGLTLRESLIVAAQNIIESNKNTENCDEVEKVFGVVQVSSDVTLSISNKYICIVTDGMAKFKEYIDLEGLSDGCTKKFRVGSLPLTLRVMTYTEFLIECKSKKQLPFYCSLRKAQDFLDCVTNFEASETFKPAKRVSHRVRDFAKETGVPFADRGILPVIRDVFGSIVYVYGLGFTDDWVPNNCELVVKLETVNFN